MKRCPECRRDYHDDSLLYCLDDGNALLEGPAGSHEMPTAILSASSPDNVQTIQFPSDSGVNESTGSKAIMTGSGRRLMLFGVGGVVVLAVAVALTAYFKQRPVTLIEGAIDRDKAREYFLRGKTKVGSTNAEDNEAAIKFLEQAVAADPNFAEAYALLAQAYNVKSFNRASREEMKRLNDDAEFAVEKALSLNPNLASAHLSRGLILWTSHKRFPHEQAIRSFKRAIELDPNLDDAHHWLAVVYYHIGLLDKASEELEKTMAINPNNTLARFRIGTVSIYSGRHDEALTTFKSVPRDVSPVLADRAIADALFRLGRTEESAAVVEEYFRKFPRDEGGNVTSVKAMLLAQAGKTAEAEAAIQRAAEIGEGYGHFHHTAYNIAGAYALLGRPEDAVRWLKRTAEDGFPCYPYFQIDHTLDNIRDDPAFIGFMAKLKLEWERYNGSF